MHSLGPGYLVMLHFIHDSGSIAQGFDVLDGAYTRKCCAGTSWCVNGTKTSFTEGGSGFRGPFDCLPYWALVRSFLLHFAPILLLHLDLRLNFAELAATHAKMRSAAAQFYLVLIAPVWLALIHRDIVFPGAWTWKYATPPATPSKATPRAHAQIPPARVRCVTPTRVEPAPTPLCIGIISQRIASRRLTSSPTWSTFPLPSSRSSG